MSERLRTPLILLALFMAAWLPRAVALEHTVTVDERKWLARSANFYQAVSHGDWANTFQREHPGVTVMWAGTLALLWQYPAYPAEAPGQFGWDREYFEAWLTQETDFTPLELLAAGRRVIALLISLAIALGYLPLRRLLGAPLALTATLFVAWDPFGVAMSQQLHPDGFVSALTFLALLLFLTWLYAGLQRRVLVLAGIVMGLAWLTKTPAIFLVPTGAVLMGIALLRRASTAHRPSSTLVGFIVWGLIAILAFIAFWPAMWVDPLGSLLKMRAEMGEYVERHTTINYFWGRPVDDPGPLFYPIAYLFRTTPAVLIGLVAAAAFAGRRRWPFDALRVRQTAMGLLLFALVLAVGMTLGAKKFDRYLLPAFPALAVIAALGWGALGHWVIGILAGDKPHLRAHHVILTSSLVAAFVLHGLLGFLHYPYYLTYYNPLTGGGRTAPHVLFVGWGEGLDEAARWLNRQPEADHLRVASWYADGPFSYFFHGQAVDVSFNARLYWVDNDFTVLYVNQWQRQLPSAEAIAYFLAQSPVHTVRAGGMDLAYVYDTRTMALPDFVDIGKASAADFGGLIRLSGYDLPPTVVQPGEEFLITLYLRSLAPMTVNYNVLVRLVGQDGVEIWRDDGWPWGAPTADWPVRTLRPDGHAVVIPPDAAPGLYQLTVSFYDPTTFATLPATTVQSDTPLDSSERVIALLAVDDARAAGPDRTPEWRFGDTFGLTGVMLPATAQPSADLPLSLTWQALRRPANDYTVFVHLVDAGGFTVAQQDQPPLGGFAPTRLWPPDLPIADSVTIPLPGDLPAGEYEVRVGLYTLAGGRLPVFAGETPTGDYAVVGQLTIP